MTKRLRVLVTGATGKQGGATARILVTHGHSVRALTRNVASPAAHALAATGVELVHGDLQDRDSVARALAGMDAMFLVTTPFGGVDAETETRQGIAAADAARAAGTYLVYTSVANADRRTGIPHFDSKFAVEEHIRAIGLDAAIIAPAYFMENVFFGLPQLRQGIYGSPLAPRRSLMQVAVGDIGAAAVSALQDRARYAGKRYDLAGDELSGEEQVSILSKVAGRPLNFVKVPMDAIRGTMGSDGVKMYEWFDTTGYTADRTALRRDFPEVPWLSFEAWAGAQNWKALLGG
jgi:uncharacterized protein YbjT (DUF2867 family)